MRRMFPILAVVMLSLAVVAPLRVTGQTDPPVIVTVVCKTDGTATDRSVNVDPYVRTLSQTSRWRLNINRPNDNSLCIKPKDDQPWPYTGNRYCNEGGNGPLDIPSGEFTGQTGTFYYAIDYTCDGVGYTIDPRMDVGGGGE